MKQEPTKAVLHYNALLTEAVNKLAQNGVPSSLPSKVHVLQLSWKVPCSRIQMMRTLRCC